MPGVNWIMITQLDVFMTNSPFDDCAYPIKNLDLNKLDIAIKRKQEGKATWYELIIQNGRYQLLALGGIIGSCISSSCTPFLGSSIPCTSDFLNNPTCFVLNTPAQTHQTFRYLRDYAKSDAILKAGFLSARFKSLGLAALHPLFYKEAFISNTSDNVPLALIGSYILSSYISRSTSKEEVQKYLCLLKKSKYVSKMIKYSSFLSLEDLYDNHAAEIKGSGGVTRTIIEKLYIMEEATNCRSPINMALVDDDSNPKLRGINKKQCNHILNK